MSQTSIAENVFVGRSQRSVSRFVIAFSIAVLIHALVLVWASRNRLSMEEWTEQMMAHVHESLERQYAVSLQPMDLPLPPPSVQTKPSTKAVENSEPSRERIARAAKQETSIYRGPVDLSDNVVVTGNTTQAPGGVTAVSGTSNRSGAAGSKAEPVSLIDAEWTCPWPKEAQDTDIVREVAIVKVMVNVTGMAEAVDVVQDPGRGFGKAAVACALRKRYRPARDEQGNTIRSMSPPIRVIFTR